MSQSRSLLLALIAFGCDGTPEGIDPIDPSDPIDPPAARCAADSELQVWVDGEDHSPAEDVVASSVPLSTTVSSPVELAVPWHLLTFTFGETDAIRSADLPGDGIRIEYSLNPNNAPEQPPSVYITTDDPVAANWSMSHVEGELHMAELGIEVGEERCGSFDARLTWQVIGGAEHQARLRGRFSGLVRELMNDEL